MNRLSFAECKLGCCIVYLIYLVCTKIHVQFHTKFSKDMPLLLWWTNFPNETEVINCSDGQRCIVSGNQTLVASNQLKALLFYGTYFDLKRLPQRDSQVIWALFHEESPKNLPALRNPKLQQVFNYTATFSRHSSFPLTLQYLRDLYAITTKVHFINTAEKSRMIQEDHLATTLYLQSDCDTAIGRDAIVSELMQFIKIDSFGACLNNKVLPEKLQLNGSYELYGDDLLAFVARYKFVIAIENAICDDYITEKLWRPLIAGAIPIYLGSPTVKDWLPNHQSAILIDDFSSIESLAHYMRRLHEDEALYNSYLRHKLEGHISNKRLTDILSVGHFGQHGNFVDSIPAFQCFVCQQIHANHIRDRVNHANVFNCDAPRDKSWLFLWSVGWQDGDSISHETVNAE